jgi:type IX secretion system PorP/SprF family membrane protein
MRKLHIFLFLGLSFIGRAQQDAIFSQYTFNPLAINPAYAGSRSSFSAVLLHRSQWIGFDGAPNTQTLAVHSPVNNTNLAAGLNLYYDRVGPSSNLNVAFTGAYHLKLKKSKLSFAIRGGVYQSTLDKNQLVFKDQTDIFSQQGTVTSAVPTFDFGVYYYKTKFFLGLAINHLNNAKFSFFDNLSNGASYDYKLKTHVFLNGGYVFDVSDKFIFKPTFLLKSTEGAPANLDLSFNFLFYKKLWLGISFRNKSSVNFMTEWNITDYLRIGYAYDLSVNKLTKYNRGSHEIFIGLDFNIKSKKVISPRYL